MKVCVFGLLHLGCVTAVCMADLGFNVIGLDNDNEVINNLQNSKPPIFEPGLEDLLNKYIKNNNLSFSTDFEAALSNTDVLWITFDTPVDDNDIADVDFVKYHIVKALEYLPNNSKVIISSQVPVGFTKNIENIFKVRFANKKAFFACSPENLRLGNAINIFREPDRIIIGVRNKKHINEFLPIFSKISDKLEWMKTESAEMTKHAINSFLAISVVFANELACICEKVGANAKEVERGLKTEDRIGPKAYVRAGSAFAGGTLARDVNFLIELSEKYNTKGVLFNAVKQSNDIHKDWIKGKTKECFAEIKNKKFAILGLTYKPNTNTLRRSLSIELCKWLSDKGAKINAYDPHIKKLPDNLTINLCSDIIKTIKDADCIIVGTEHKVFKELNNEILDLMSNKVIIDPNAFLEKQLKSYRKINYFCVGKKINET
ncbi:nucleotide sugar dehydrogenase [Desulfobacterota bacterium AH_259_B03_O07]|nr:nucleotide sugar dehydrogenase [Desulfobacterota bacterium AH_259_B03_O07]